MRIIPHWRRKLARAYSSYAFAIVAFGYVGDRIYPEIAEYLPLWLRIVLVILFIPATLIEQPELRHGQK